MAGGKKKKGAALPDAEGALAQLQHEIDAISAREDWSLPAPVAVTPLPADATLPAVAPLPLAPDHAPEREERQRGVGVEEKRLLGRALAEQMRRLGETGDTPGEGSGGESRG